MPQPNEEMLNALYGLQEFPKFEARFPGVPPPHIAVFRAYKFQRLSRQEPSRLDCIGEITLQMPSNLSTAYNAHYETPSIGALFENLVSRVNTNSATTSTNKSDGETLLKVGVAALASDGIALLDSALPVAGGLGSLAIGAFGVARNPHKVVMYQGSDFRVYNFEYQFTPRNSAESFSITNIIKAFKYYMSASYGMRNLAAGAVNLAKGITDGSKELAVKSKDIVGDTISSSVEKIGTKLGDAVAEVASFSDIAAKESRAFFGYPEVFRITLMPGGQSDNPHIFQIAECVLQDFKVDYDPQGGARYVRGEDNVPAPASVRISMSFKETSLVTKENIRTAVVSQTPYMKDVVTESVKTGSGL
jgi:hypothetical protein